MYLKLACCGKETLDFGRRVAIDTPGNVVRGKFEEETKW
jgi:hypothetical protein